MQDKDRTPVVHALVDQVVAGGIPPKLARDLIAAQYPRGLSEVMARIEAVPPARVVDERWEI